LNLVNFCFMVLYYFIFFAVVVLCLSFNAYLHVLICIKDEWNGNYQGVLRLRSLTLIWFQVYAFVWSVLTSVLSCRQTLACFSHYHTQWVYFCKCFPNQSNWFWQPQKISVCSFFVVWFSRAVPVGFLSCSLELPLISTIFAIVSFWTSSLSFAIICLKFKAFPIDVMMSCLNCAWTLVSIHSSRHGLVVHSVLSQAFAFMRVAWFCEGWASFAVHGGGFCLGSLKGWVVCCLCCRFSLICLIYVTFLSFARLTRTRILIECCSNIMMPHLVWLCSSVSFRLVLGLHVHVLQVKQHG